MLDLNSYLRLFFFYRCLKIQYIYHNVSLWHNSDDVNFEDLGRSKSLLYREKNPSFPQE